MPIPILMPALSPTMEEGTLAKWHVKVGDTVSAGDVIAEIETDKATMEVEAVDEGTVGKLLVEEGTEGVKVNAPIAVLLEEGEDESALEGYDPAGDAPVAPSGSDDAGGSGKAEPETAAPEPEPSEPAERASPQPAPAVSDKGGKAPPAPTTSSGKRVFASPLARRLASQEGLDLTQLSGSGPHGRVVRRDIQQALEQGVGKAAPATAAAMPRGEERREKHPTIRKTIARRMTESKQSVPHFYLTVDFEIDALLAARAQINEGAEDYKVSVNDMIVKACALALRDMPNVNASFTESEMIYHGSVDVSVAVATERGLMVPIIRNADAKGLRDISNETKALAAKARDGKLMPEEYQGGGFSVSNLGMYGIREFAAIINPPQSAILAVGAGEERPVVRDGELVIATMMSCTLSVDHRAVDGALGAEYLQVLRRYIEKPATMLL